MFVCKVKATRFLLLIFLIIPVAMANIQEHEPKVIPDLAIYDLQGKQLNLEKLEGNVIILHFWATWCSGCAKEMESLNKLQKIVKKDPIIVIPISEDFKGHEVVETFYQAHNLRNLTAFIDPNNKLFRELKVLNLPTSFIIDATGKNVAIIKEPIDWTKELNIKFLKKFISNKVDVNQDYLALLSKQKMFEDTKSEDESKSVKTIPGHAETYVVPKQNSGEEGEQNKAETVMTTVQNKELSFKIRRPVNSSIQIAGDKNE